MGGEISEGDLLTMRKLNNTDATSHLHIDQRNITSAAQIKNTEIKKPQYVEKNRRTKNEGLLEVFLELVGYCVTPSWGFQVVFYFLKQIKNNLDNVFFPNKLIRVEKSSPFYHVLSVLCGASS